MQNNIKNTSDRKAHDDGKNLEETKSQVVEANRADEAKGRADEAKGRVNEPKRSEMISRPRKILPPSEEELARTEEQDKRRRKHYTPQFFTIIQKYPFYSMKEWVFLNGWCEELRSVNISFGLTKGAVGVAAAAGDWGGDWVAITLVFGRHMCLNNKYFIHNTLFY